MLEPLLMFTFLNCLFMFSTTVTTCALWLQHKRGSCCVSTDKTPTSEKKEKFRKKIKDELLRSKTSLQKFGAKLAEKKRDISRSREKKVKMAPPSQTKSFGIMAQPDSRDIHQQLDPSCSAKLTSTEDFTRKTPSLPRSAKRRSTVVMEVSTIQKVVQMIDNERNPSRESISADYVSCRVPPDAERRIEFIVQNKSDDIPHRNV